MAALFIYYSALLVHHVVVFEQALTDTEVVLLDLLLCTLDTLGYHRTLDHLAFLESEAVHHTGDTLGGEKTHEFVFERYIEDRRTGVALTSGTTTQLAIDATAFVALCTDDGKTSGCLHLGR